MRNLATNFAELSQQSFCFGRKVTQKNWWSCGKFLGEKTVNTLANTLSWLTINLSTQAGTSPNVLD